MQSAVGYSLLVFVLEIFGNHSAQTHTFTHMAVKTSDNIEASNVMHHKQYIVLCCQIHLVLLVCC